MIPHREELGLRSRSRLPLLYFTHYVAVTTTEKSLVQICFLSGTRVAQHKRAVLRGNRQWGEKGL